MAYQEYIPFKRFLPFLRVIPSKVMVYGFNTAGADGNLHSRKVFPGMQSCRGSYLNS